MNTIPTKPDPMACHVTNQEEEEHSPRQEIWLETHSELLTDHLIWRANFMLFLFPPPALEVWRPAPAQTSDFA